MKAGWEVKSLGEVTDVQSGFAFKSANYCESGHFLVRIGNVQDGELVLDKPKFVLLDGKTKRYELAEGDVLTSLTGNIGRVAVVEEQHLPAALNQRVARLVLHDGDMLNDKYFLYFLYSDGFGQPLRDLSHGAAQQNVSPKAISDLPIPIPPLEEQKRIVAVLDAAFEGLTRAAEHAKANLQNARELFARYVETLLENQDDTCLKELQDCATVVSGHSFLSTDFASTNSIKSIKITNVGLQIFNSTETALLPDGFEKAYPKFVVHTGSIVIALTRSVIAGGLKFAIVPESFDGALLNQRVAALTNFDDVSMRDYIFLFLSTPIATKYIRAKANTTMQPNLSINDLRKMTLRVPNMEARKQVVAKAHYFSNQIAYLEEAYQTNITDIADLRQSLLQKAFAGELT